MDNDGVWWMRVCICGSGRGVQRTWGGCKQERGSRVIKGNKGVGEGVAESLEVALLLLLLKRSRHVYGQRMTFAMQVDGSKHLLAARKVSGVLDGRSAPALALTNQDPVNLDGNGDDGEVGCLGCLGYQRTRQHSEAKRRLQGWINPASKPKRGDRVLTPERAPGQE